MHSIFFARHFKHQLKKLEKKFPHVRDDLLNILEASGNPLKNAVSLGKSIYKLRVGSTDMRKGKSGGFRVYIYFYIQKTLMVPLCMYTKSSTENMSDGELKYHFDQVNQELLQTLLHL